MTLLRNERAAAPLCRAPGPERRRERRFLVDERRSGFDRRRSVCRSPIRAALEAPALRLLDDPVLLIEMLVLVNLLSILDLIITLTVLEMGAVELNPLMAYLIELGTLPAVAGATLGLWLLRRRRAALTTTVLLLAAYGSLIVFELVGLVRLV